LGTLRFAQPTQEATLPFVYAGNTSAKKNAMDRSMAFDW
jgi:hypothetical protein